MFFSFLFCFFVWWGLECGGVGAYRRSVNWKCKANGWCLAPMITQYYAALVASIDHRAC